MRKATDPGAPAPPAPGSVGPAPGSPEDWWPEEETKPDATKQPELLKLVRLVDSMAPVERRRFVSLVEHYTRCGLGRRVLLEEIAREFAAKGDA